MTFVIRIGGTSDFVSHINPDDLPEEVKTVSGWHNRLTLHFDTQEEAADVALKVSEIEGCSAVVELLT